MFSDPAGANANSANPTNYTKDMDLCNSWNIRAIRIPLILVLMEDGLWQNTYASYLDEEMAS